MAMAPPISDGCVSLTIATGEMKGWGVDPCVRMRQGLTWARETAWLRQAGRLGEDTRQRRDSAIPSRDRHWGSSKLTRMQWN
jgi:hypothetical protein